jgi:hypothetical protein
MGLGFHVSLTGADFVFVVTKRTFDFDFYIFLSVW